MDNIKKLKVKIFFDGAKLEDLKAYAPLDYIKGFTTNPSLMKKAGVTEYEKFVKEALPLTKGKPISFEVISDEFPEMKKQALKIASLGENIYVKIPVTNTKGESSVKLIDELTTKGVKINITAIMTLGQIKELLPAIRKKTPVVVSVFAGRIADTGIDPVCVMKEARGMLKGLKNAELLWASPRELLNIIQADEVGCDIITVVPDVLVKLKLIGYDLRSFSLDTVKMFYNDAVSSGLRI
jgi:transaldolase